jgi:small subunit ribosomal protein S4
MARYTEARCRQCRREGQKLFLKGNRCYSSKCALSKRATVPGQHGAGRRRKQSEYGLQLREKQKTKRFYGLQEKQFRNLYIKADRQKGNSGINLLRLLELRFDNVVYRLGFGESRAEARQLVTHGHFKVNGKKANIPSMTLSAGDTIELTDSAKNLNRFKNMEFNRTVPQWLSLDQDQKVGKVLQVPNREDVDVEVEERMIVELYSR